MEVLLHSELLLCDCLVCETGRAHHRPVNVCHLDNNIQYTIFYSCNSSTSCSSHTSVSLILSSTGAIIGIRNHLNQNIELKRQNDYSISPDEEHGLGPAGGLCVPGVAQYQPPHLRCPHGLHHGTGGSNVAPSNSKRQIMACRLYNYKSYVMHLRDWALVVREPKTGEHSVLTGQVRGQTLRLEHISLHHGEVGVGHRLQLAGAPHQGGDGVSPRQGLLHRLKPWVQTTKLELLFHFYKLARGHLSVQWLPVLRASLCNCCEVYLKNQHQM